MGQQAHRIWSLLSTLCRMSHCWHMGSVWRMRKDSHLPTASSLYTELRPQAATSEYRCTHAG